MGFGLALSGLALFYFLRRVDGDRLWSALVSANLWILCLGVLTRGAVFFLNAERTRVLLIPLRRYTFFECLLPWLSGYVADNLLPFRLGELVRVDLLARAGRVSRSSTVAVVGLDRLIDLLSLLLLVGVAVPLLTLDIGNTTGLLLTAGTVAVGVATALWLATRPSAGSRIVVWLTRPLNATAQTWLIDKAQRFFDGFGALRSPNMILTVIGITLLARVVGMLTIQCWLWAFGLSLPIYAPLVILLFISVGTMVPSSPGFIGTFHIACAYALELMGVVPDVAASVAIAGHFVATVPWTLGGLLVSFPGIRRVWQQQRESIRPVEHVAGT